MNLTTTRAALMSVAVTMMLAGGGATTQGTGESPRGAGVDGESSGGGS